MFGKRVAIFHTIEGFVVQTEKPLPDGSTRAFVMNALASAEKAAQSVLWDYCLRHPQRSTAQGNDESCQADKESQHSEPGEVEI